MTMIRADVYAAITDNNLSSVIFVDPFFPVTRQSKRNLLVASFIGLLIAVLDLEITGFLGLNANNSNLGNDLAQGLACIVVLYFLITTVVHTYADMNAWQFRRERQATEPYLELIQLLERTVHTTGEQIRNACDPLQSLSRDSDMQSDIDTKEKFKSTQGQLNSIDKNLTSLIEEMTPLIASWKKTIEDISRLKARLRVRIASLWLLDITFPIALALVTIWVTKNGVAGVFERIAG